MGGWGYGAMGEGGRSWGGGGEGLIEIDDRTK